MVLAYACPERGAALTLRYDNPEVALDEAMRHVRRTGGGRVFFDRGQRRPIQVGAFYPVDHWRQRVAAREGACPPDRPLEWTLDPERLCDTSSAG